MFPSFLTTYLYEKIIVYNYNCLYFLFKILVRHLIGSWLNKGGPLKAHISTIITLKQNGKYHLSPKKLKSTQQISSTTRKFLYNKQALKKLLGSHAFVHIWIFFLPMDDYGVSLDTHNKKSCCHTKVKFFFSNCCFQSLNSMCFRFWTDRV